MQTLGLLRYVFHMQLNGSMSIIATDRYYHNKFVLGNFVCFTLPPWRRILFDPGRPVQRYFGCYSRRVSVLNLAVRLFQLSPIRAVDRDYYLCTAGSSESAGFVC
jgi:hypothetical protein